MTSPHPDRAGDGQERRQVELTRGQIDFLVRAGSKLVAPITSYTPPDWIQAMLSLRRAQDSFPTQKDSGDGD